MEKGLKETQLLPVLQFTERILTLIVDYKRSLKLDIVYNSEEQKVTYGFDIELELGKYQASIEVYYDEVKSEETNDWADLIQQINHIESVLEA